MQTLILIKVQIFGLMLGLDVQKKSPILINVKHFSLLITWQVLYLGQHYLDFLVLVGLSHADFTCRSLMNAFVNLLNYFLSLSSEFILFGSRVASRNIHLCIFIQDGVWIVDRVVFLISFYYFIIVIIWIHTFQVTCCLT